MSTAVQTRQAAAAVASSAAQALMAHYSALFGAALPGREPWIQELRRRGRDSFVQLGLPTKRLEEPIHLVYIGSGDATTAQLRNLVVAHRQSQLTVIEHYLGAKDGPHFTNTVSEIVVGENAHVTHYKVQEEADGAYHLGTLRF